MEVQVLMVQILLCMVILIPVQVGTQQHFALIGAMVHHLTQHMVELVDMAQGQHLIMLEGLSTLMVVAVVEVVEVPFRTLPARRWTSYPALPLPVTATTTPTPTTTSTTPFLVRSSGTRRRRRPRPRHPPPPPPPRLPSA